MKCPKCSYLGFDTGERCKNCGYNFSLMAVEEPAAELSLRIDAPEPSAQEWTAQVDATLSAARTSSAHSSSAVASLPAAAAMLDYEPAQPPPSFRGAPALPLFGPASGDDEPLIKVPASPRAPLAVRRTPESPRLRSVPRSVERPVPEPALDFTDDAAVDPAPPIVATRPSRQPRVVDSTAATTAAGPRLLAAVLDLGILLAIDAIVVYLTLRMASLTMSEWTALPLLPMVTFLGLLKLSYFSAFTCVGGQTIGKMAAGIRVVSEDGRPIDVAHAIHRALAGALSFATLGAGFVPALLGADRCALHDRLAHTRVVRLPAD